MSQEKDKSKLTVEAEEFVISMAMISPRAIDRMSVICKPWQFLDKALSEVWELLINLRESEDGVSVEKLRSEMIKRGTMDRLGGLAKFAQLITKSPNPAHCDYYAGEVVRYWGVRTIHSAALQLLDSLQSPTVDPQSVILEFQAKVDGVASANDAGLRHICEVSEGIMERDSTADAETGTASRKTTTGFQKLDYYIDQLQPGKLYLLGGRTGRGKTALAANIASAAALSNKSVWFVSLEMGSDEIVQRILTSTGRISSNAWRRKLDEGERGKVAGQIEKFRGTNLWFTEKGESFRSLKAKARLAKSLYGLDLVIIDNLQLIKAMNYRDPKHERMKALTEAFKNNFAKELGVAVLLLAQLAVDAEEGIPDNTSWADSKRIVDDADVAMILHRYTEKTKVGDGKDIEVEKTDLILTKNRAGQCGNVSLEWDPEFQNLTEVKERSGF
jgi:replicative DNA helicase